MLHFGCVWLIHLLISLKFNFLLFITYFGLFIWVIWVSSKAGLCCLYNSTVSVHNFNVFADVKAALFIIKTVETTNLKLWSWFTSSLPLFNILVYYSWMKIKFIIVKFVPNSPLLTETILLFWFKATLSSFRTNSIHLLIYSMSVSSVRLENVIWWDMTFWVIWFDFIAIIWQEPTFWVFISSPGLTFRAKCSRRRMSFKT